MKNTKKVFRGFTVVVLLTGFAWAFNAAAAESSPAATVRTRQLEFQVASEASCPELACQVRKSLSRLLGRTGGSRIAWLRAYVGPQADPAQVQSDLIADFRGRRTPIPALGVIQVSALPDPKSQVLLESVSESRKVLNPHGLAFISGQGRTAPKPMDNMTPVFEAALAGLQKALSAIGEGPSDALSVGCYSNSSRDLEEMQLALAKRFPGAAAAAVEVPGNSTTVECDAVARLRSSPAKPLVFVNPKTMHRNPAFTQITLVDAPRVVMSELELGSMQDVLSVRRPFENLSRLLNERGASIRQVAMSWIYPITPGWPDIVDHTRFEFYDHVRPPASTFLNFRGLPLKGATFGVQVLAPVLSSH